MVGAGRAGVARGVRRCVRGVRGGGGGAAAPGLEAAGWRREGPG